jgi:hypothetical protein
MSEATQPWVLESGECSMGDHEIVEIFLGTEDEAAARAAELNQSRSALDAVDVFAYPVTRPTPADVVITTEPRDVSGVQHLEPRKPGPTIAQMHVTAEGDAWDG